MARRLAGFRALGHEVLVVAWGEAVEGALDGAEVLPIGGSVAAWGWRLLNLARAPWYGAARIPWPWVTARVLARARGFAPDLVWVEGVHGGWLARRLARRCGVPLVYRAHNIEHRYLAAQARLATGRRRWALWLGTWGLRRAEVRLQRAAARVWDISGEDLEWWRARGLAHGGWLPPLAAGLGTPALAAGLGTPPVAGASGAGDGGRDVDLVYVGGLDNPANRDGLMWFLRAVMPRVRAALGEVSLVVAGRAPDAVLGAAVMAAGGVLVADPGDVDAVFARGRVMVNPVRHGSGVNIKTIDMLGTGRVVVTTPVGARGLPAEAVAALQVAGTAEAFAGAVAAAVLGARAGVADCDRAGMMARVFGIDGLAAALAEWEAA